MIETASNEATGAAKESSHQRPKDSQWSSLINDILNKKSETGDATIQPLTSWPMSCTAKKIFDTSLSKKEPVEETLTKESEESNEDESITEHPLVKKRKLISKDDGTLMKAEESNDTADNNINQENDDPLMKKRKLISTDDGTLMKAEESNDTADNNINQENDDIDRKQEGNNENDKNEDGSDDDSDDSDGNVLEREEGGSTDDDENDNNDNENISESGLKARLYRSGNNMKVYELNLDADEGLNNIDILKYIDVLKVPKFRGVFMRDELPERSNPVECGIVNLSAHKHLGTHWVSYAKIHNTCIYFDSFGRKTPLEIQKYLKTAKEFRNNIPVIERNTDIVQ